MDLLTIVILVLCFGYLLYVVLEKVYYNKIRKSFKYVIHVNGIRGKSTTTRLIDAGIRGCGYKVFSKTTGTFPTMINVDNELVPIKRLGNANIREQLKIMRLAYKAKAEVLVIECMAINPALQYICEHQMLNSDVTVITNVRMDHVGDMGDNLEEIATALANTIPNKGYLVINDDNYLNIYKKVARNKNVKIVKAKPYLGDDDLDTFKDNIGIALEVCDILGLDHEMYFNGMKGYHHDQGAYKEIKVGDTLFMNALSVNDPESIKMVYDKVCERYNFEDITILLNVRSDRATRTLQYIEMLKGFKCKKLIISGPGGFYLKKELEKECNIVIEDYQKEEDLLNEKYIFATGNIAGNGVKILKYFEEKGEPNDA